MTARVVIVDEIHAFAGDDRGRHLVAVLDRIDRVAAKPVQRIGLSATVGNPGALLTWLSGGSGVPGVVVGPGQRSRALSLSFGVNVRLELTLA